MNVTFRMSSPLKCQFNQLGAAKTVIDAIMIHLIPYEYQFPPIFSEKASQNKLLNLLESEYRSVLEANCHLPPVTCFQISILSNRIGIMVFSSISENHILIDYVCYKVCQWVYRLWLIENVLVNHFFQIVFVGQPSILFSWLIQVSNMR